MLNTAKFVQAKIDTSKNFILENLWATVQQYNALSGIPDSEKVYLLERILVGAGEWLTSHPPKTTTTNVTRWNAMEDLANQCVMEGAKLGARFLTGPTDWKQISGTNRSYWLEYLSPNHGVGFQLSPLFERWKASGGQHQSFWEYADIQMPYGMALVKYYGGTAKAEKRRVIFKADRKLYRAIDDSLFDSEDLETAASGDGWAIFVVSVEGNMYAHKHVVGKFHHSTFLSGSAVAAAGEMVVEQGIVKFITAKSGHYIPTVENMKALVRMFPYIPMSSVIMPDFKSNPPPAYSIKEFKFNPNSPQVLKRAQAEALLPLWAKGASAMRMIDKIAI